MTVTSLTVVCISIVQRKLHDVLSLMRCVAYVYRPTDIELVSSVIVRCETKNKTITASPKTTSQAQDQVSLDSTNLHENVLSK